jgi:DNA-binding NarL/FixJ family response regulator
MPPIKPIKIVIADDHHITRLGFQTILQKRRPVTFEFVAEAKNGAELLEAVALYSPDVVVTDINMPVMNGIDACKIVKRKFPNTGVLAISAFPTHNYIYRIILAGADGYISKTADCEEFVTAIEKVSSKCKYYSSCVTQGLLKEILYDNDRKNISKTPVFGAQEKQVIKLLCQELTTKEIAQRMNLACKTIEHYRENIQFKIGAKNAVGVAIYAMIHGIVTAADIT